MGVTMEMTKAYLDSKGLRYRVEEENRIRIAYGDLDNIGRAEVLVIFDDNDTSVGLRCFNVCNIPENKVVNLYEVCSKLNERYRWIKFFVDENDNTITAADDAIVQAETSGEEVLDLVRKMIHIVDEAYPEIMKSLWS